MRPFLLKLRIDMSDKKKLDEGKIKKFLDKIVYGILHGVHDSMLKSLKKDPEMERAIKDYEESADKLENELRSFIDGLE